MPSSWTQFLANSKSFLTSTNPCHDEGLSRMSDFSVNDVRSFATTHQPHLGTFSRSRKPMALHIVINPDIRLSNPRCNAAAVVVAVNGLDLAPAASVLLDAGMAIFRSCLIAAENASNYPNDSIPPDILGLHVYTHIYRNTLEVPKYAILEKLHIGDVHLRPVLAKLLAPPSMQPFCIAAPRTG